jgi:hypothetical protein
MDLQLSGKKAPFTVTMVEFLGGQHKPDPLRDR